ncbi:YbaN family protein [Paracoccus sp. Z330]|uniref:YbaN family protein n=1 Tax=Paracoccus onchidii TaxID=3017813 RepID=A0ABT4ZFK8_9RHOB|nr:YbaN family protein [Paracoccus onchidii]MDB6178166.1 YbaN family protein [Paracoccus onchidii]
MRLFWYAFGAFFLGLAIIGIALPVMPTVPFLLVAAWAFAKSSPELRRKIQEHPTYGPSVRAWQERGAISRNAKIWAVGAMTFGIAISFWVGMPVWVVATQASICAVVGVYVTTRPDL